MKRCFVAVAINICMVSAAFSSSNNPAEESRERFFKGKEYLEKGAYNKAIKEFRKLMEWFPDSEYVEESRFSEALCYELSAKHYQAFKKYETFLDTYPSFWITEKAIEREYTIGEYYLSLPPKKSIYIVTADPLEKAVEVFQSVVTRAPFGKYAPDAQFKTGMAYKKMGEYTQAIAEFKEVINRYHDSPQAQDAKHEIALCSYNRSRKSPYDHSITEDAIEEMDTYVKLTEGESGLVEDVQTKLDDMMDTEAKNSYQTAQFYEIQDNPVAASIYYQDVVKKYPASQWADKARQRIRCMEKIIEVEAPWKGAQKTYRDALQEVERLKRKRKIEKGESVKQSLARAKEKAKEARAALKEVEKTVALQKKVINGEDRLISARQEEAQVLMQLEDKALDKKERKQLKKELKRQQKLVKKHEKELVKVQRKHESSVVARTVAPEGTRGQPSEKSPRDARLLERLQEIEQPLVEAEMRYADTREKVARLEKRKKIHKDPGINKRIKEAKRKVKAARKELERVQKSVELEARIIRLEDECDHAYQEKGRLMVQLGDQELNKKDVKRLNKKLKRIHKLIQQREAELKKAQKRHARIPGASFVAVQEGEAAQSSDAAQEKRLLGRIDEIERPLDEAKMRHVEAQEELVYLKKMKKTYPKPGMNDRIREVKGQIKESQKEVKALQKRVELEKKIVQMEVELDSAYQEKARLQEQWENALDKKEEKQLRKELKRIQKLITTREKERTKLQRKAEATLSIQVKQAAPKSVLVSPAASEGHVPVDEHEAIAAVGILEKIAREYQHMVEEVQRLEDRKRKKKDKEIARSLNQARRKLKELRVTWERAKKCVQLEMELVREEHALASQYEEQARVETFLQNDWLREGERDKLQKDLASFQKLIIKREKELDALHMRYAEEMTSFGIRREDRIAMPEEPKDIGQLWMLKGKE